MASPPRRLSSFSDHLVSSTPSMNKGLQPGKEQPSGEMWRGQVCAARCHGGSGVGRALGISTLHFHVPCRWFSASLGSRKAVLPAGVHQACSALNGGTPASTEPLSIPAVQPRELPPSQCPRRAPAPLPPHTWGSLIHMLPPRILFCRSSPGARRQCPPPASVGPTYVPMGSIHTEG